MHANNKLPNQIKKSKKNTCRRRRLVSANIKALKETKTSNKVPPPPPQLNVLCCFFLFAYGVPSEQSKRQINKNHSQSQPLVKAKHFCVTHHKTPDRCGWGERGQRGAWECKGCREVGSIRHVFGLHTHKAVGSMMSADCTGYCCV